MRHFICIVSFQLISILSIAQDIQQKNVPAVVLNAFQLKFPNATEMQWKLEKGNYRIGFEVNNKDNSLVINDKGRLLSHQQDLYVSEIPKIVMETIQSKVAFFDVNDADKLEENGTIVYKIYAKINEKSHEFRLDDKGKLLKYTKELKNSELPVSIAASIRTKYGSFDIDEAKITEEGGKISYQLKVEIGDNDHKFLFHDNASMISHEQELRISEIPVAIINGAKAAYNGFEIRKAELSEEGGKTIYTLEMKRSKEKFEVLFNQNGDVLEVRIKQ
jgi:uncharacterized membrane protein YkoI